MIDGKLLEEKINNLAGLLPLNPFHVKAFQAGALMFAQEKPEQFRQLLQSLKHDIQELLENEQ